MDLPGVLTGVGGNLNLLYIDIELALIIYYHKRRKVYIPRFESVYLEGRA